MTDLIFNQNRLSTRTVDKWQRLKVNRQWLGFWFMLPAVAFLVLFLAYPLGLGVWLSFTDAKIGRTGAFIGIENYVWLWGDSVFWLSVFNTLLYTIVASAVKFAVGLYLALLLNENLPFKALLRAIVLIPFIVPTVLSAIAFWWIYDAQFSIVSWSLRHLGVISGNIDFLGNVWNARWSVIFANIWRGVPFVAITLLAGLQTVSPSLYEAATIDGASPWQVFRHITYPLLTPIIAVVMTFSVLFTFTDFQLIWVLTRGGPVNATQLMATLSYQRAILSGQLGEGAAISTAMIPFLLAAILISWFGLQRRKWQQGWPGADRKTTPDTCEIGHTWLSRDAIRTGANTEMKRLMLTHAFEVWQVRSVCLHTDARNERSRAAIQRIGGRFEGVLRAHRLGTDLKPRDSARFSITAADWPAVRQGLEELAARYDRS